MFVFTYIRRIRWLPFLIALAIALNFTSLRNGNLYYVLHFVLVVYCIFTISRNTSFFIPGLLFIFVGFLSLLVNPDYNKAFSPYLRLIILSALFFSLGPIIKSNEMHNLRYNILNYLNNLFIIIVIGSFVCYIFTIPIAFRSAGFAGLTTHPMDLSPISGITALVYRDKLSRNCTKKQKYLYISLFTLSVIVLFISASRGAILAFIVSFFMYTWIRERNISKTIKYIGFLLIFILGLLTYNPMNILDGLNNKMERTEMDSDITGGRGDKFIPRFLEFEENPIFGCGFSTMKYTMPNESGSFEAGSGWVFILSSMGLAGVITVFFIFFPSIFFAIRKPFWALFSSLLVFMTIHSCIEGYILTCGNSFCTYIWLLAGFLMDRNRLKVKL